VIVKRSPLLMADAFETVRIAPSLALTELTAAWAEDTARLNSATIAVRRIFRFSTTEI